MFYDSSKWELTKLLKDNYAEIKEEILGYYGSSPSSLKSNFTPYDYEEKGWKTVNLYTYGYRYSDHCKQFPFLDSIVKQIPGMTMCQIAVLEPGVRVKAHLGDTNAIIRNHIGITVPGKLPELGLKWEYFNLLGGRRNVLLLYCAPAFCLELHRSSEDRADS